MSEKIIDLDDLRTHLNNAKDRISLEKQAITGLYDLPEGFSREEYAFAYIRAERLGMRAINRRLAEIAWLPMQLDPKAEIMSEGQVSMKRWLTSALVGKPDSRDFGNDFIHTLARGGIKFGWDDPEVVRLSSRIANLFRDLSCLIGLIYYCTWLSENNVEGVQLSNPKDLNRSAEEIAALIQSPELYRYLRAQEQDDEQKRGAKAHEPEPHARRGRKKAKPALRVIENEHYFDPLFPDPVNA